MRRGSLHAVLAQVGAISLTIVVAGLLYVYAQGTNQVGLVVRYGDGSVITRCVKFEEAEISGYDVLLRSDLEIVADQSSGAGVAICRIQDEGCPASSCFCKCSGSTCGYWAYWHLGVEDWSYSPVGADRYRAHHGDVEGWSWGASPPPPVIPFEQICAPPATATPLSTLAPTSTLLPSTAAPQATDTRAPSPTVTRTPTPSATATATEAVAAQSPSPTPSPTSRARPVAALPSPTLKLTPFTPTPGPQRAAVPSNYVFFGVFMAVLLVAAATILIRRRR